MTQPFLLLEIKPTEPKTYVYRKIWTCMFSGIFHDSQKAEMTQISINWQMDKWNAIHIPAAATAAKSLQSCSTLCGIKDGSPPGSPVPGILQARTLERVAIAFSNAWKWKVKVKSLNCVQPLATPWTADYQALPSMGFSRQEYWRGLPLPSPYNGIKWQQILNAKWMPEGERKLSLAPYCPENEVQVYLVWHSWYLMNRLPLVFQPLLFTGIFHLEATLIISITVFTLLSMYTDLLSLEALLTYFPFLYIWILPAQGLNCHFLKWQPTPVFSPGESRDRAAWWAAIYGVAQSQIRLKWLSSSSSRCQFLSTKGNIYFISV